MMLYAVWFILIARLLMPVTITSGISFITLPTQDQPTASYTDNVGMTGMFDNTTEPTINSPYSATNTTQHQEMLNEQLGHNATVQANQPTSTNSKLNITWEMVLITIWLIGIAVMLTQIGVLMLKLRKRIKIAKTIPAQWQGIADQLQTELGFKRSVRIVMIEHFPSPALCGGIKPVIVLPCEMDGKGEESIRFALLHEMTHIKRGDHIVSMLLLLLRAVYWFNPVVWLMMKQMRLDIETACDSCLTKSMPALAKKRYAGTMLSMYAQEQIRYVLGMSMGQTKKTAERRLRGMFMRSRSSRKSKIVAIVLTTVLLVTCFTTACQPSPEKSIVVNKADGKLEEAIDQKSLPEGKYDAPESWQEKLEMFNGKLKVDIKADIVMPDVSTYPVSKVVPGKVSQEMANKIIKNFFKDTPVYEEAQLSKAELQEMLIDLKAKYEEKKNNTGDNTMSDLDTFEQWIKDIETAIETAPETAEKKLLDTTFKLRDQNNQYIYGEAEMGGQMYFINIDNGRDDYPYASVNISDEYYENLCEYAGESDNPEGVPFSKEEAITKAQDYLESIGITDMYPANITMLCSEYLSDDIEAYAVWFERSAKGIQVPFRIWTGTKPPEIKDDDTNGTEPSVIKEDMYSLALPAEQLRIIVNEEGVCGFYWDGITEVEETINENVALMPFDDVKERFMQMYSAKNAFGDGEAMNNQLLYIDRIEFGYARVSIRNEADAYMYVPAWAFYGGVRYLDENGDIIPHPEPDFVHAERRNVECMLAINAIDGSNISSYDVR